MGIDWTCLFKSDSSLEANKNSLTKSLNGFDSNVKIEKSSNKPTWLQNKQWSLTANSLLLLTYLPVKADRFKCSPDLILRWRSV